MPFQVCIKTEKSLRQLAEEIRDALSLPLFTLDTSTDEPYCQFDMLGMQILLHKLEEEERDPEVKEFSYYFDLQLSFSDHELDSDLLEYNLQPYYAQLLAFRLNVETACHEKKKVGPHWQVRYCYFSKNPKWDGSVLFGEPGWQPATICDSFSPWRTMRHLF